MNTINILYIIDNLGHGGTERQLVAMIRGLDHDRFRLHLCTLKPSTALLDELDIPKLSLGFVSFLHPSIFKNLVTLSGFIRENRIHIVQTFFQDPFLLSAMIKPFHNVKLIGSFRDLGFWRTPSESLKMRMAYPFFDGFIANSQAVKEHFAIQDNLPSEKIEVIYNGFDLSSVHSLPYPNLAGSAVVGIVANLNRPVKRVQDFIKAAAIVSDKRPEVSFIIVGGGYLQSELESLVVELGIARQTTFTGKVANPLDYIAKFIVGVITSETEGFCNAIIEYMACGVPVVASRVGGNPELVEEGVNGYLYEAGDYEKLADSILHLLESAEDLKRIGAVNKAKIIRQFSIERMLSHTESYYEFLVGNEK